MSGLRLYLDEDAMDRDLVRDLRSHAFDVLPASDLGMVDREDEDHLSPATNEGRILLSFNIGDYQAIHTDWIANGRPHAGMILARQQHYSIGEFIRRLTRLSDSVTAEEMRNRLEFLSNWTPS